MSDHHQHGVLIARPPHRAPTQPAASTPPPGVGRASPGAVPFSGRSTLLGRILSRMFAERPSGPHT
jgi:hypothetical protein